MVAETLELLGADAGFVATVTEDGGMLSLSRLGPSSVEEAAVPLPLDAPYPIAAVARSLEPLFIADNEDLACNHAGPQPPERRRPRLRGRFRCAPRTASAGRGEHLLRRAARVRRVRARPDPVFAHLCELAMDRALRLRQQQELREAAEQRLADARVLELNDDVVQSLAVATLAAELGDTEQARRSTLDAFEAAKRILAALAEDASIFRRDDTPRD